VVAFDEVGDPGTDGGHHAGGLVAEHHRGGGRHGAVDEAQVAVADAAVRHPHGHLAGAWLLDLDVVADHQRFPDLFKHRSSHLRPLVLLGVPIGCDTPPSP
jgi:hypothetical protein